MEKLLCLYLKTGGGHISSAKTVAQYIEKHHPGYKTIMADGFTRTNKFVKKIIEDGYRYTQTKANWVFEGLYALSKIEWIAKLHPSLIAHYVEDYIMELIVKENPDKIVIFHFFLSKPVLDNLKSLNRKTPVVSVVTDPFTLPPIWLLNKNPKFIVFSERAREQTIARKIEEDKISVFPYIVNERYNMPIPENHIPALIEKYGFANDKKLILILGGGDGIPKGSTILEKLLAEMEDVQFAIVCGNNKTLYNKALRLKSKNPAIILQVFGFVDFVYDLLNLSHIVITKGGPATIMEILLLNKIPVINNYIWEQEKGNMEFVRDNNLGLYEKDIDKLPQVVKNIVNDQEVYDSLKKNILTKNIRNGVEGVSNYIVSCC